MNVVFYSAYCDPRPIRLSEETRQFAWDSMHFRYGLEAEKTPYVDMEDYPGYEDLTPLEMYDAGVRRIAEQAPIRIVPGERISGSATLGGAIDAFVPVWFHGEYLCECVSHLTVGFDKVLRIGMDGIAAEVEHYAGLNADPKKVPLYTSMRNTIESMRIWHRRYLDALPADSENRKNLERVPFGTPTTFYEAVQSLWFTFAFVRLLGNWTGIGRLDKMLGDYLENDLACGRITIEQAREILAHFFIKGCEWIRGKGKDGTVSGDSQHYQNIVLGGVLEDGSSAVNEVTYLVLDIIEEFGIGEFPVTVGIDSHTDPKLLHRMAEVMRHGGGTVAVYNNEMVLETLQVQGIPYETATAYANDGCWEVQIPGHTCFCYTCLDALSILQKRTLQSGKAHYDSYEALKKQFDADLLTEVGLLHDNCDELHAFFKTRTPVPHNSEDYTSTAVFFNRNNPCTIIDLLEDDCIRKGVGYFNGGTEYTVYSPHIGGLADAVNSLYAIRRAVFEDHLITFDDLMAATVENWEGREVLRQRILNGYRWFGNDNDEVDAIYADVVRTFSECCRKCDTSPDYRYTPGVSTFGRQIGWTDNRMATVFGKKAGTILSGNSSPTPGTDVLGATAAIRSYCKADPRDVPVGSALDLCLSPGSVLGEDGIRAIESLMRGLVSLGGFFLQLDVVGEATLRAAKEHPEDFPTLSVRVSGWNARFVTLDEKWQNMIIERDAKRNG